MSDHQEVAADIVNSVRDSVSESVEATMGKLRDIVKAYDGNINHPTVLDTLSVADKALRSCTGSRIFVVRKTDVSRKSSASFGGLATAPLSVPAEKLKNMTPVDPDSIELVEFTDYYQEATVARGETAPTEPNELRKDQAVAAALRNLGKDTSEEVKTEEAVDADTSGDLPEGVIDAIHLIANTCDFADTAASVGALLNVLACKSAAYTAAEYKERPNVVAHVKLQMYASIETDSDFNLVVEAH